MSGRSKSYQEGLYKRLIEDEEALLYLQTALEDSQEIFLVALQDVIAARQMVRAEDMSGSSQQDLSTSVPLIGDPKLSSIQAVLEKLGYRLSLDTLIPQMAKVA